MSTSVCHACFSSDTTVLASCDLMSHALTQLPYCLIAALLTLTVFVLIA